MAPCELEIFSSCEWMQASAILELGEKNETIDLDGGDLFGRADRLPGASPGGESGLGKVAADPRQLLEKSCRCCRRDARREVHLSSDAGTDDVREIGRSYCGGEQLRVLENLRRSRARGRQGQRNR